MPDRAALAMRRLQGRLKAAFPEYNRNRVNFFSGINQDEASWTPAVVRTYDG